MILNSPYITGSLTVTGNIISSGSITISGSIASASYALTASNALLLGGWASSSFAPSTTFNTVSSSFATTSGSLSTRVTNNESTGSTLTTASASFAVVSSSFATTSGSISSRVTLIEGQYATTGSNGFNGNVAVTGSLNVTQNVTGSNILSTGNITAQTLVVQTVTSSIVYSSGSNIFGNQLTNVQQFTGSLRVTGSGNNYFLGGNVGIGTTTPTAPLTISASAATSIGGIRLIGNTYSTDISYWSEKQVALKYSGSFNTVLSSDGTPSYFLSQNVGIGTSSPSYTLDVSGSARITAPTTELSLISTGTSNVANFSIQGGEGAAATLTLKADDGDNAADVVVLRQADQGPFTVNVNNDTLAALSITSAGVASFTSSVGIGTTNPTTNLEISAATGNQLKIATNDATAANNAGIFFYNESSATAGTRRSYMLLDPNGANGSGGDYSYFDMYGSGTARVMNQLTAGVLALGVGGTNIMTITGSSVGIGNASPSYKLDVSGQVRIDSTYPQLTISGSDALITMYDTFQPYAYSIGVGYNKNYAFEIIDRGVSGTSNNTVLIVTGSNVGIGTTSPSVALEVSTQNAIRASRPTSAQWTQMYYAGIENSATNDFYITSGAGNGLIFRTDGGTERMRITSGGNVLLGSSTDYSGLLQVNGQLSVIKSSGYGYLWYSNNTANNQYLFHQIPSADVFLIGTGKNGTSNQPALALGTVDTERMRITSGGNVIINNSSSTCQFVFDVSTGNAPQFVMGGGAGSNTVGAASNFILKDGATSGTRQWLMQIDGSSQFATWYYGGSSWTKVGYQTTGGTWTNSDQRRKENIELLTYGLNEVLQLTPKKFNFKIDENKKPHMGFIAQDILPIIPEAVQSDIDGEEQYYAMNYDNLVPVLVKAIQEQQAQIEALKTRLETLENI